MSEDSPFKPEPAPMLPHSPDAEKALIGSFLMSPDAVSAACQEAGLTHEEFYVPSNVLVFSTLIAMVGAGKSVDLVTLSESLTARGQLDAIGGFPYLSTLFTSMPSAANAGQYVEILQEKHVLRQIIRVCTAQAARGYIDQDDPDGVLSDTERAIFQIVARRHGRHANRKKIKALVMEAVQSIQDMIERKGAISGLSTGLQDVDDATDGMHDQELIVIAGRPSSGKTALAMGIAEHLAIVERRPVAVFSLEMSARQLVQRLLLSRARVNLARIRRGITVERDYPAINKAASILADSGIHVEEGSDMTIGVLRSRARAMKAQHGVQAIFIDSLSVLKADKRTSNRVEEVGLVTNGLKECAKELGIPVVLIAHINREAEKSNPLRPSLKDLRESGNIEQDADSVWFVTRPELFAKTDEQAEELAGQAVFRVGKSRTGSMGFDVPLTWLKEFARFETCARPMTA